MKFIEDQTETKLRGGYYTPQPIAEYLTRWVLNTQPSSVLEPSCGDGVFLSALARLTTQRIDVTAFELDPREAHKASLAAQIEKKAKVAVHAHDFLEWGVASMLEGPKFDAIIGNPPFVRYQYLSQAQQDLTKQIFEFLKLPFTLHTNLWVPFVLTSIALLKPGGAFAMVIPAEILHVLHAGALRQYLVEQSSEILIIDPEELIFPQALQGAVLFTARKKGASSEASKGVAVIGFTDASFLDRDPASLASTANFHLPASASGKWMDCLLSDTEREILRYCTIHPMIKQFAEIASVDVGIVTGANDFFLVDDASVQKYALESRVRPMFGRSDHARGLIYDESEHNQNRRAGLPTNFLHFDVPDERALSAQELKYIRIGEGQGIHLRYKCRIRKPWFKVPSVYTTAIGMLKRSHESPRLIYNPLGALTTDTAYRITTRPGTATAAFVYSFVNTLTSLSCELEGRHYGGGVLELVPSEIERVLVPFSSSHSNADLRKLHSAYKKSKRLTAPLITAQDEIVLAPLMRRRSDLDVIRHAWFRLGNRRKRKTATLSDNRLLPG